MDPVEQEERELLRRGMYEKRLRPGFYIGTFLLLATSISVGLYPMFGILAEQVWEKQYTLTENPLVWVFWGVTLLLGVWGEYKQPFSPYQQQAKKTRLLRGLIMTVLLSIVALLLYAIFVLMQSVSH